MSLRVIIEDLAASGIAVTGLGEDLAAACGASDGLLSAAQAGWQGRSGVALAALAERWTDLSRDVVARLGGIADGVFASATAFGLGEQDAADALGSLH